jgi:hypothetical protein
MPARPLEFGREAVALLRSSGKTRISMMVPHALRWEAMAAPAHVNGTGEVLELSEAEVQGLRLL